MRASKRDKGGISKPSLLTALVVMAHDHKRESTGGREKNRRVGKEMEK